MFATRCTATAHPSAAAHRMPVTRTATSATDRRPRVGPPEYLGADHAHQVDHDGVEHHRLGGGCAHPHRASTGGVAVVATDDHDHRGHRHALDQRIEEIGWVLEHPED